MSELATKFQPSAWKPPASPICKRRLFPDPNSDANDHVPLAVLLKLAKLPKKTRELYLKHAQNKYRSEEDWRAKYLLHLAGKTFEQKYAFLMNVKGIGNGVNHDAAVLCMLAGLRKDFPHEYSKLRQANRWKFATVDHNSADYEVVFVDFGKGGKFPARVDKSKE